MNKGLKTVIWIIVIVLIVWGIVAATGSSSSEPIKIGFTGPLTGELANMGSNAKAAVDIAVEEVNAEGGIDGRPLEVIFEDDQCTGAKAVSAVNKLISVDKVPAIVGSVCSPATLAYAPVAEKAKTVGMSFCSTAPKISDAGDYIFRDVPSDLFQGTYAAKYAFNTLGKKKVAIVYLNNDWGIGLKKAFGDNFKQLGGEVVLEEGFDATSKDLRSQMTKAKNSGADLLYYPGFPDTTVLGVRQAKELGINIPILGADAWDDSSIWSKLGPVGNGIMYTVVGTNSSDTFKAKMKEKLGNDNIIYCSNYAYDAVKIFAKVMGDVGVKSEDIKNALYKVKYENGVSSNVIEFDANGDPKEANYIIKVIKNGKAEEMK